MGRGAAQDQADVPLGTVAKSTPALPPVQSPSAMPSSNLLRTSQPSEAPRPKALPLTVTPCKPVRPLSDLERVQRKWQMASCAHFLTVFASVLPLKDISPDTAEDLTPSLLERGIAEPDLCAEACIALRDVIVCLLVAIGAVTKKNDQSNWFHSLRVFVGSRSTEFLDCYQGSENLLASFENGMDFLVSVGWNVRLGMLLALCDIAAEESVDIREALRDSEQKCTQGNSEINAREYRLLPIGRCSKKRFHYKVGTTRIYSGYKRKGSGAMLSECSDSKSMSQLADALASSGHLRDFKLASKIKEKYLAPLLELEERSRRKVEKKRLLEIQKEESRRRNSGRPRRSKASYF